VTALQSRWDEHRWQAGQALAILEADVYVDDDFAALAARCTAAARDAGEDELADRWSRYEAETRRRLGTPR
jgi:hypothetical protein